MKMKKNILLILFLIQLFILNSCSVTNYIKRGFENFTTYFNIYYNAAKIFDEAERELNLQQKDLFTTKVFTPGGNVTNKFVQVIEKCSKILQYHSNSSLVDDALFMIGKSYYYQKEYPSAIRKFTELITNFPESDYYLESKFWIARSYAQGIEFEKSLSLLNDVYLEAKNKKNKKVMSNSLLEILKIYFKKNDHDGIINIGNEFVKVSKDKNAIAQVYLLMGTSYAKLGQLDKAIENYQKVKKYTSDFYYQFKSQLELAKIFREKNEFEESKKILDYLSKETLFDEYKDYTELEYGYLYLSTGDTSEALKYFIKVDTSYSSKETGGIAQYELAGYLENVIGNLDSAKFYYDKSLRTQIPDDIKKIVQTKSSILNRYKNLWTGITNLEKQITLLKTFPVDSTYQKFHEIEIDSAMLSDSAYLADLQQYFEEKRIADSLYAIKLQQDSLRYKENLKTADSIEVNIARLKFDLASLFMVDYNKPDSAYRYLKEIVDKFPDKDFSERTYYALANYYSSIGEKEKSDSLFRIIYDRFADSEISKIVSKKLGLMTRILKNDQPEIEYREAEILIEQEKYHEALKKLDSIYNKYQNTDYAPKSLLMIGYVYENKLKMYDSAYSVYKRLKEKFPASLYTQRINSKLIAYESELQRKAQEKNLKTDSLNSNEPGKELNEKNNLELDNDEEKLQELKEAPQFNKDSKIIEEKKPDLRRRR